MVLSDGVPRGFCCDGFALLFDFFHHLVAKAVGLAPFVSPLARFVGTLLLVSLAVGFDLNLRVGVTLFDDGHHTVVVLSGLHTTEHTHVHGSEATNPIT
tara:strand:- start:970 stop:1266 length:297 start_codon:yes stop_codon:yes gene_type:complete